jgi:hypothetical protein
LGNRNQTKTFLSFLPCVTAKFHPKFLVLQEQYYRFRKRLDITDRDNQSIYTVFHNGDIS